MDVKYLLVEDARIIVCDTEEQRKDATLQVLQGMDETEVEDRLVDLENDGVTEFEGDPPIYWEESVIVPFEQFITGVDH